MGGRQFFWGEEGLTKSDTGMSMTKHQGQTNIALLWYKTEGGIPRRTVLKKSSVVALNRWSWVVGGGSKITQKTHKTKKKSNNVRNLG